MYKLLIVDDEELVRKAIITKLDWSTLGFEEVFEAEDGEQALEIALKCKPDIVLTDVRMPFMDGIELADRLRKELPETKVVILSGHDEFEYAQEAIKAGVLEYILKPIRSAKLAELMQKLKTMLDDERKEKDKLFKLRSQLHQSLPLLKERFLNSLINNSISEREIAKKLDYLDISLPGDSFTVCVSEIDNLNALTETHNAEDIDLLNFSVLNIISELVGTKGLAFNDILARQVIIFNKYKTHVQADENVYPILENIRKNVEKFLNITVTIGIGSSVCNLKELNTSYKDALHALDYKLVMGKNKIYNIKDLGYRQSAIYYPVDRISHLLSLAKLESVDEVKRNIDAFFNDLMLKKDISPDNIKVILSDLINGAQKILMEAKGEDGRHSSLDFGIYNEIAKYETLDDIKVVISRFMTNLTRYIQAVRNSRNLQIVEKAKQFINENYFLEELSLNYVANAVSVSPGYLSILFRRETNENFVEYLTRVRMEKAKELLKISGFKAYEVAYKVGYSDPHYFSICFKKYTGFTPSEYKNNG